MKNYTQQTDRIRDKTIITRAIKEVKKAGLNELFYFFLLIVIMKSYKYSFYLKLIY